MPSQHKHRPIPVRLPEGDRAWLLEYAKQTGQPVNRILTEALQAYRATHSTIPAGTLAEGDRIRLRAAGSWPAEVATITDHGET